MNTTDIKRKDYGAANFTYDEDWNLLLVKKSGNEKISFCEIGEALSDHLAISIELSF